MNESLLVFIDKSILSFYNSGSSGASASSTSSLFGPTLTHQENKSAALLAWNIVGLKCGPMASLSHFTAPCEYWSGLRNNLHSPTSSLVPECPRNHLPGTSLDRWGVYSAWTGWCISHSGGVCCVRAMLLPTRNRQCLLVPSPPREGDWCDRSPRSSTASSHSPEQYWQSNWPHGCSPYPCERPTSPPQCIRSCKTPLAQGMREPIDS